MRFYPAINALLMALLLGWASVATAQSESPGPHVAELAIDGPIGPATTDYLQRTMTRAQEQGAQVILIRMDTPGGLDAATRDIIKTILASPLPVVTYVHPAGGRAASAGTYILYASHIAAMTPSTTLGAATPVQMGGMPSMPGGDKEEQGEASASDEETGGESAPRGSAMERKVVNDAVAFIRGLAERRGRNADWAERAVREAATLTASEALEQNVVDVVADNRADLLEQIQGLEVMLEKGPLVLQTSDLPVETYEPDWRSRFLSIITNPQIVSILLLIGIYGLILEGYNPGAMVPGVVGVISLLVAFYALQVLPVNYVGLALIVVGAVMILAEAFMPSFGVLGFGGLAALVVGSIMLVDSDIPGMEVSWEIVGAVALVGGLVVLGIITMLGRSLRMPRPANGKGMVGRTATVAQCRQEDYKVVIDDEYWNAISDFPLSVGEEVQVVDQQGLILVLAPVQ